MERFQNCFCAGLLTYFPLHRCDHQSWFKYLLKMEKMPLAIWIKKKKKTFIHQYFELLWYVWWIKLMYVCMSVQGHEEVSNRIFQRLNGKTAVIHQIRSASSRLSARESVLESLDGSGHHGSDFCRRKRMRTNGLWELEDDTDDSAPAQDYEHILTFDLRLITGSVSCSSTWC